MTAARTAVSAVVRICGEETARAVELICSELVTNAVIHAQTTRRGYVELQLQIDEAGITGSVSDTGGGFDAVIPPEPRVDGGYGLVIVERLATRWGVMRRRGLTTVWFEL